MCFHDWRDPIALPAEHCEDLIFLPCHETCAKCGAERVSHRIESAKPIAPHVQAPAVPYATGGAPVQLPLFMEV